MNYRFEDCTNHNICLYHELNLRMGFDKSIEIRRKSQEFEMSMKKRISNPYEEEIVTGSKADGFRHGKSDVDYLVIFKDVKILDLEEEVVQYRNMGKKRTLKINKDPEYWEDGYVLLKYISGGSDTLPKHVHCINCSKLNGFVSSHRFKESVLDMRKNESLNNNFFYTRSMYFLLWLRERYRHCVFL